MTASESATLPQLGDPAPMQDATINASLASMRKLLSSEASDDGAIALPERLNRGNLDFSLDSLHEIDRYLNSVHDNSDDVGGVPLLSTISTIAMYVGEVIRREAPAKRYEWVSVGEPAESTGETTISARDLSSVRVLRSREGNVCAPSREVLRIILRGSKARSIHGFVRSTVAASHSR